MGSIRINKIHFPVTTLGYGRRICIWTQGCSIRCTGCISRDTWESGPGHEIEVATLVSHLAGWLRDADGVTVSGGEPFDQPEVLGELLREIRRRLAGDILVYSGYSRETLFERHPRILDLVDVLISEPYRADAGQTLTLRGSDNQRIFLLTELARTRYPADIDTRPWQDERHLDLMMDGDNVWLAGIPRPAAMAQLRSKLLEAGFSARTSEQVAARIRS